MMVLTLHYSDAILVAAGLLCGLLIGLVAIGGVLMVPILYVCAGFPLRKAVAISMAGYILTGILGFISYYREAERSTGIVTLAIACLVGASLGSLALGVLPSAVVAWLIVVVILLSVFDRLQSRTRPANTNTMFSKTLAGVLGVVGGFGSAISGTGGPLLLLPVFSLLRLPPLGAISLAQALQLPIAVAATAVNWSVGSIPLIDVLLASVSLLVGMLTGIHFSHKISPRSLAHAVTVALIVSAVLLSGRQLWPIERTSLRSTQLTTPE